MGKYVTLIMVSIIAPIMVILALIVLGISAIKQGLKILLIPIVCLLVMYVYALLYGIRTVRMIRKLKTSSTK